MIYFTADSHFRHAGNGPNRGVIAYCNRPWSSIEEHDEALIENWNKTVSKKDEVYHLGDFSFGKNKDVRKLRFRLNGKIHLILGNHDYRNKVNRLENTFSSIHELITIKHERQIIVLCHYALRVWDRSRYNTWQLYGHSHGNLSSVGKQLDVGVDSHNYRPISFEEVKEIMKTKPDNPNYKTRRRS